MNDMIKYILPLLKIKLNIARMNLKQLDVIISDCEVDFRIGHIGMKKSHVERIYQWCKKKERLLRNGR